MRKLYFIIIMFSFFTTAKAQKDDPGHQKLMSTLQDLYNSNDFKSIFHLFSKEMAQALPIDQALSFFSELKRDAGNMVSFSFHGYEEGFTGYSTLCERGRLLWLVSADKKGKINGLLIKPDTVRAVPLLDRNISSLLLPFRDRWKVVWGGTTREQNYHVVSPTQRYAFDFIITDAAGKSYKTNGAANEDYYAFGKELIAPCDGEVVMVVDGIPDNNPGQMNTMFVTGNTVILKTSHNEFLVFAHFKKHSIVVREGQAITRGSLLGLCGNSGNSSEAHLHFHIQDGIDLNTAMGVACYFDEVKVNGQVKKNHMPLQGEWVENLDQ